jgi:hypothetical protein
MSFTFSESALHKISFCKVIDSIEALFRVAYKKQMGILSPARPKGMGRSKTVAGVATNGHAARIFSTSAVRGMQ